MMVPLESCSENIIERVSASQSIRSIYQRSKIFADVCNDDKNNRNDNHHFQRDGYDDDDDNDDDDDDDDDYDDDDKNDDDDDQNDNDNDDDVHDDENGAWRIIRRAEVIIIWLRRPMGNTMRLGTGKP